MVLGRVGGSWMCRRLLDVSVILGCVDGSWMCRWFLDVSVAFSRILPKSKCANNII